MAVRVPPSSGQQEHRLSSLQEVNSFTQVCHVKIVELDSPSRSPGWQEPWNREKLIVEVRSYIFSATYSPTE